MDPEEHDPEEIDLFYGIMSSIGYEKRIAKILLKCIGFVDEEEAKRYLAVSEGLRERLQFLFDRNQEGDRTRLDFGLSVIQKVLSNLYNEPQNEKFHSLRFDSAALGKVLCLAGGLEFLEHCGFEKKKKERLDASANSLTPQTETYLVWNPQHLNEAMKCFQFVVAILDANYFHPDAIAKDMWKGGGGGGGNPGVDGGEAARKKQQKEKEREAAAEHQRAWKDAWDARVDDRNWVCHCCWREIVQYKSRALNSAGWYDSSNERGGYGYRFECVECKDFQLCQECYDQWDEQLNAAASSKLSNSQKQQQIVHDLSHAFRCHPPENKVKSNRGPAPDPRNYRRKWG